MITNLVTQAIVTFFGGKIVVWVFSKIMGTSYAKASILSGNQAHMKGSMLHNYITSYKSVIYNCDWIYCFSIYLLIVLEGTAKRLHRNGS